MIHTRYESCTITLLNNVTYCDTNREFKDITIFNTNKNREFNDITIFDMNKNRDYHDANHEFNDITMFIMGTQVTLNRNLDVERTRC